MPRFGRRSDKIADLLGRTRQRENKLPMLKIINYEPHVTRPTQPLHISLKKYCRKLNKLKKMVILAIWRRGA